MEKLNKAREEICEQCESGIYIENCKECLFNMLNKDKQEKKDKE